MDEDKKYERDLHSMNRAHWLTRCDSCGNQIRWHQRQIEILNEELKVCSSNVVKNVVKSVSEKDD